MATKNDKVILNLKKEIEEKKKLLMKIEKFNPITNCSLDFGFGNRINIHAANKQQLLFGIAQLQSLKKGLAEIMPSEELLIGGYSADEWLSDLTARFNHLNISLEKDRLQKLEQKLHDLLSVDTKVGIEIENLKSQI